MNSPDRAARLKTVATYDAAADHFDAAPLAFWSRHGQHAVDLLALAPGQHVLDVGCGTGASALPAARAVGPTGRVVGIDIAANMLARAGDKAAGLGLGNLRFELMDMGATAFDDASFDAVVSVFSVFFVPDIERQVAELWRLVRPGGKLAVVVWGEEVFQPGRTIFGEETRRVRPDLPLATRPWERFTSKMGLRRLMLDGGTADPSIHYVHDRQPLTCPEDWWTMAMGSGFRWEIDQMTPRQQQEAKERVFRRLTASRVTEIVTDAIFAVARKAR